MRPVVPGVGVLERGVDLHVVDVGRLALLGAADHRERRFDFGEALERLGDRLRYRDRFVERGRRDRGHAPHDRAFLQLRHELLAEEREQRQAARERHDRDAEHATLAPEGPLEHRPVATLEPGHEAGVLLGLRLQDQRGQHRDQRQRQDQRARHRERDLERHRLEHLAFEPFEREQRQEHHDDDDDGEGDRVRHLLGRGQHGRGAVDPFAMGLSFGHDAEGVLDHDDGAVDHHADADRQTRERHQVGRQAELLHADEGDQHRERQGHDHDEGGAQLAQEQEQDDGHQDRAFDQRAPSRCQRPC